MPFIELSKETLLQHINDVDIQVEEAVLNKAENDDPKAFSKIADIYYDIKNYSKAMNWYLLGAAKGDGYSQWNLGLMYQYGEGVPRDKKEAFTWYLDAATNGNKAAQYEVAYCYEYCSGTAVNKEAAIEWYEKSATQGYIDARTCIDRLNRQGHHISYRQRECIKMENMLKEKNKEIKTLQDKLESLEQKLEVSENKNREKDEKIEEFMREISILKPNNSEDQKENLKSNPDKDDMSQLGEAVYKMAMALGSSNSEQPEYNK